MEKGPWIIGEFIRFLIEDKVYWVTPIVILCLLLMVLAVLDGHPAPATYTLF